MVCFYNREPVTVNCSYPYVNPGMSKQFISRVLFSERVTRFRKNDHSSSLAVTDEIKRPTREHERTTLNVPLFGLAPSGVYKASAVTGGTGELLPHPFTLTSLEHLSVLKRGGFLSVALSFPSPGLGVTQRFVLWSPDFPPPCLYDMGGGHLFYFGIPGLTYGLKFTVAGSRLSGTVIP